MLLLPKEYVATLKLEYVFQLCVCLVLLVKKYSGVPRHLISNFVSLTVGQTKGILLGISTLS